MPRGEAGQREPGRAHPALASGAGRVPPTRAAVGRDIPREASTARGNSRRVSHGGQRAGDARRLGPLREGRKEVRRRPSGGPTGSRCPPQIQASLGLETERGTGLTSDKSGKYSWPVSHFSENTVARRSFHRSRQIRPQIDSAGNSVPPVCDMGVPMPIEPTPHAESSCLTAPALRVRPRSGVPSTLPPRGGARGWPAARAHSRMPNARSSLASMAHTWHFSITSVGPCSVE